MSTHIVLLRNREDEQYQKYLKIFQSCKDAGVRLPEEIDDYFGGNGLDNDPDYPLEIECPLREWVSEYDDTASGYEVDIDALPPGIKTIRFYNAW
jgi:hypothetical protein